jgi:hypothetical protein
MCQETGVESLNDTMINPWPEAFLFPEKQASEKGYFQVDWEKVHKKLSHLSFPFNLFNYIIFCFFKDYFT